MKEKLRVLIVDDDQMMAKTLRDILNIKGYRAEVAHSCRKALEKLKAQHFDCVLSDIKMPDGNGVNLYKDIKEIRPGLPVLLMTAYALDSLVNEGLKDGILAVLAKPMNIDFLLDSLSLLSKKCSILIVDDEPDFCEAMRDMLQFKGFSTTEITDHHKITEQISMEADIILLDMKLNELDGLDIYKKLRATDIQSPVILMTAYGEEMASRIKDALELGAYTCLYKPFEMKKLLQIMTVLYYRKLGVLIRTGLKNR